MTNFKVVDKIDWDDIGQLFDEVSTIGPISYQRSLDLVNKLKDYATSCETLGVDNMAGALNEKADMLKERYNL